MRIALAPHGSRGDVQPMLGLGEILAGRGHEIVLCAPPGFGPAAASRGFAFVPIGQDILEFNERHADDVVSGSYKATRFLNTYFAAELIAQFDQLPRALCRAELVIGGGAQFGAGSVAEALGIPYRFICYTPCVLRSASHAPLVVARQDLPAVVNRGLWTVLRFTYNRLMLPELNRRRRRFGLRPLKDFYRAFVGDSPFLATDPEFIKLPADTHPRARQLGYPHPAPDGELPAALETFLASGEPPVFLGFGSMPDPAPERTTRIFVQALDKSGQRGVISAGWAGFGANLHNDARVFVVGDCPHTLLFRRMKAIVHHGGAGTTASAVYAGVPQVVVPHFGDQHYFAHQVNVRGLGPAPLTRSELTASVLANAILTAVGDDAMRATAAEVGTAVRARHSAAELADLITDSF